MVAAPQEWLIVWSHPYVEASNQGRGMRSLTLTPGSQISLGVLPYFPGHEVGRGSQGAGVAEEIFPSPLPPVWKSVRGRCSNFRQGSPPLGRGGGGFSCFKGHKYVGNHILRFHDLYSPCACAPDQWRHPLWMGINICAPQPPTPSQTPCAHAPKLGKDAFQRGIYPRVYPNMG